jgi:N6-adenosine-specific RNA methylase IME4/ParB-like chromosome segregation protein Spo0J
VKHGKAVRRGHRNGERARQDLVSDWKAERAPLSPRQDSKQIADIKIGQRHRRDFGDLAGLARNIEEDGLLHPVVVKPDGELIAGERRIKACQLLGWTKIPVTVVDLAAVAKGEFAENTHRKDFTLSEAVAIKRTLEPIERAEAKKRQARVEKSSTLKGRALDKVAAVTGLHRTTLAKAEAIVDAAEAEPERFGKLLDDMNRTGRVNGVYKRLRIAQQAAQIRAEPPPLPGRGPYRVLVADPPWPYEIRREDPSHRATYPYPQMSIAEICALNVASIAAPDSILWLWTTNYHMLNGARQVLDAWGYAPIVILTWNKDKIGMGAWLRGQTEHCIFATRGKPIVTLTSQSTRLDAPVRAHSEKPREFYDLVESLCPAPRYADLFSRYRHNDRWDCHGDEAPKAARETAE